MPYIPPKSSFHPPTPAPIAPPSSSSTAAPAAVAAAAVIAQKSHSQAEPTRDDLSDIAMLTPRPADTLPEVSTTTIDDLSSQLESTQLDMQSHNALDPAMSDTELNPSSSNASLVSMSTTRSSPEPKSAPSESEVGTPPTSHGTPEVMVVEDRVTRYREELYAYTRGLYLEAKLSQKRKSGQASYAQFGSKQSGMEKMAAKKALARRLND